MKSDYSEKEYEMISQLSPHWRSIIDGDKDDSLMPPRILEIIAMDCFIESKTGKVVDSLRRCLRALKNGKPFRRTKEYDNLIDL